MLLSESSQSVLSETYPDGCEEDSVEVLAEYVLYKEWPEEAKISWLKDRINKALSGISELAQDQKETIPHVARWYNLIEPDNKKRLFNELSA